MSYLDRLRTIDSVLEDIHYFLLSKQHIPGCNVKEICNFIKEKYIFWETWNILDLLIENKNHFKLSVTKGGQHWVRLGDEV